MMTSLSMSCIISAVIIAGFDSIHNGNIMASITILLCVLSVILELKRDYDRECGKDKR